jgi:anti-sigma factor RsiW
MNMPDPIFNKLDAYLDGELNQRDRTEVEAHLETCSMCREELDDLRQLSSLLKAAPQPEFTPPLDFKAQFMLQLPRRDDPTYPIPEGHVLPWMAPTLVLAIWIFIQVTLGLSTLFLIANQAGFFDGALAWASSSPRQMLWISATQVAIGSELGAEGQIGLNILNDAGLFMQNLTTLLLWQVGLAVIYWGAMTLVWYNKVKALWGAFTMG